MDNIESAFIKSKAPSYNNFLENEIDILDKIIEEFVIEYAQGIEEIELQIFKFIDAGVEEIISDTDYKKDVVANLPLTIMKRVIANKEVMKRYLHFQGKFVAFHSFLEEQNDVKIDLSEKYLEILNKNLQEQVVREQLNSIQFFEKFQKAHNISDEEIELLFPNPVKVDKNSTFLAKVFNYLINKVNYKNLADNQSLRLFLPSFQVENLTSEDALYDIEEHNMVEELGVYLNINANLGSITKFKTYEKSNVFIYPNILNHNFRDNIFKGQKHAIDLSLELLENKKTESCILIIDDDFLQSEDSLIFRKRIVESNYLHSIVFFPERYSNSIATSFSLFLLTKKNITKEVRVVDLNDFSDLSDIKSRVNISFKEFQEIYENEDIDTGARSFKQIKEFAVNNAFAKFATTSSLMAVLDFKKKNFEEDTISNIGKFLLNYSNLKFNRSKNLEQYPYVSIGEILKLAESETKLSENELVIDSEETDRSISYYINKDVAKKSNNEVIHLLSEKYLYINLLSLNFSAKFFEPSKTEYYIKSKHVPFSINKTIGINEFYLIEALKEINYPKFLSEMLEVEDIDLSEVMTAFYDLKIILPPLEIQKEVLISKQVKLIQITDKKLNEQINQNQDLEEKTHNVQVLEHSLNGALGEMYTNINRVSDIIEKYPNIKVLKKLDRSKLTLGDSALSVFNDFERINSILNQFYRENLFEVILEELNLSKLITEYKKEVEIKNIEIIKIDNLKRTNRSFILGDEGKIKIILDNLFENSVQHAFDFNSTNKFKIELNNLNDKIILSIYNTGRSFSEDMTLKKFTTRKTSTKKSIFSGSGGYLIKKIMDGHKGAVRLNTKKGGEFVTRIDLVFDSIINTSELSLKK